MKIVHLSRYFQPHKGGVETHVVAVSQELVRRGHQVQVITRSHQASLPLQEKISGVEVYRFEVESKFDNPLLYKLNTWSALAHYSKVLHQADIIQAHDVMWWLLPLLPLFWTKTYLTFHGWEGQYPVPFRNKLARWLWSRLALRTVHVGDYIRQFYWDQPDQIMYGGVDTDNLPVIKPTSKLNQPLKLVFVGRLETANEIKKYLQLIKDLKRDRQLKVIWVGDGAWREKCQQLGQVTGMVDNPATYITEADLVLAASYLSMLQAQVLGKIVIAFYSHSLKKTYLQTYPGSRFMLINDNVTQVIAQIEKLLTHPQLAQRFARQAQTWAQQQTWGKVTDQYQQLWNLR